MRKHERESGTPIYEIESDSSSSPPTLSTPEPAISFDSIAHDNKSLEDDQNRTCDHSDKLFYTTTSGKEYNHFSE